MKKIQLLLTFTLFFATLCFAGSSPEEIKKDLEMYSTNINPKVAEHLKNIEQEMIEIDNIIEGKSKKDIKINLKIIDNQVKAIETYMQKEGYKIKTPEVIKYHNSTLALIKKRNEFIQDVGNVFVANGNKLTDNDKEKLVNKHAKDYENISKENAEILKSLMEIIH